MSKLKIASTCRVGTLAGRYGISRQTAHSLAFGLRRAKVQGHEEVAREAMRRRLRKFADQAPEAKASLADLRNAQAGKLRAAIQCLRRDSRLFEVGVRALERFGEDVEQILISVSAQFSKDIVVAIGQSGITPSLYEISRSAWNQISPPLERAAGKLRAACQPPTATHLPSGSSTSVLRRLRAVKLRLETASLEEKRLAGRKFGSDLANFLRDLCWQLLRPGVSHGIVAGLFSGDNPMDLEQKICALGGSARRRIRAFSKGLVSLENDAAVERETV